MVNKKLLRSKKDRKIAGVCGGLAEYFETDPTLVRLAVVVITLLTGFVPGIIGYIIAWAIIPE